MIGHNDDRRIRQLIETAAQASASSRVQEADRLVPPGCGFRVGAERRKWHPGSANVGEVYGTGSYQGGS